MSSSHIPSRAELAPLANIDGQRYYVHSVETFINATGTTGQEVIIKCDHPSHHGWWEGPHGLPYFDDDNTSTYITAATTSDKITINWPIANDTAWTTGSATKWIKLKQAINWVDTNTAGTNAWVYRIDQALNHFNIVQSPEARREQQRLRMRAQMQPSLASLFGHEPRATRTSFKDASRNEIVALKLLRTMISEEEFKKYLRYGIVSTKGESGLTYVIQKGSHIITVRDRDKLLATLCIYIQDKSIPPTDEVVAKLLMCECDEQDVWARSNNGMRDHGLQDQRCLTFHEANKLRRQGRAQADPRLAVIQRMEQALRVAG